jgi:hypothetical protein
MIYLAIGFVSAGILGYQVLLARLFSIVQWSHFAYMIISMALLGYGASGTFLSLARERLAPHFSLAFSLTAALFGLTSVASFALGERLPFNSLAVIWDPGQFVYLLLLYVLFTAPFFFGANCVGLAFACLSHSIGRVYRSDLLGAGAGALAVLGVLFLVPPSTALLIVGATGFVGAALASLRPPGEQHVGLAAAYLVVAVTLVIVLPPSWIALRLSEYKGLSMALTLPNARVLEERSSPLGLVSVVESPTVPFRYAPGLSLKNAIEPPAQLGIFTDGDSLSVITTYDGRPDRLAYLDATTAALPYHLITAPTALILGAGGGADVLRALYCGVSRIDAVELNPDLVHLVRNAFRGFAGNLYDRPDVHVHIGEARGFVRASARTYDLIELPLLDSLASSAAGTLSLSESYIYTIEALEDYLQHLRPGGYIAITRWLQLPPRDSLKLFATAVAVLERAGASAPAGQLALIWNWSTVTLIVKNGLLTDNDTAAVRRFARERAFDVGYLPGLLAEETNRFNVLAEQYFRDGGLALLGPHKDDFIARYKFDIAPSSDDRPYFFDFFKWRALPELLAMRTQGGAALFDWGYPILVATLAQAALLSIVLILLPLALRRQVERTPDRWRVATYFFVIGVAFMFIEIASIQHFILFLSHPLYAIAVVLCAFLVFSGVGAGCAARFGAWIELWRSFPRLSPIGAAIFVICLLAILHAAALPYLFPALAPLPDVAKIIAALALIAPLAFWMGMPFPLAMSEVSAHQPALVPWAWGINGCASVLSAVLAQLLAMSFGFTAALSLAVAFYLAAAFTMRRRLAG